MKISIEFKKYLRFGITAAIGFIIASAWKDTILLLTNRFVEKTTSLTSSFQISSISALLITFFGVILLWISSRIFK